MRILFMDDDWTRHQSFARQLSALPVEERLPLYAAFTGEQARDTMLAVPCFDALFLDHDLGEGHYDKHRTGERPAPGGAWSGTDFVDWLVGAAVVLPKKIVVHSWNRYGANRMAMTLFNRRGIGVRRVRFSDTLVADVREWLVRE